MARIVHVEHEHAPLAAPDHGPTEGAEARVRPRWVNIAAIAAAMIVLLCCAALLRSVGSGDSERDANARIARMQRQIARRRAAKAGTLAAAAQRIVDRPSGRRAQEDMMRTDFGPSGDR